jgi:hypothetical protein
MKKLLPLLLLVLITVSFAYAGKKKTYTKGKIIYNDGKSRTGFVEDPWRNKIAFKTLETDEPETINPDDLKTIVYFLDNGKTVELDRVKHYGPFGKLSDYEWWNVAERGKVTIYILGVTMGANTTQRASFTDYYAIREGEPGAKMICSVSGGNPNTVFKNRGPEYFADYPELAEKIKTKVYTYKNIMEVVHEYNQWAAKKK